MAMQYPAGKPNGVPKGGSGNQMPPSKVQGGVNLGTFHGKHHVAHPLQGASGTTDMHKDGTTV